MPAYRNDRTGTWKALFYYTDYKNERRKKQKRGFKTKKEAQEWEREFLLQSQFSIEMSFNSLYKLYYEDMKSRIKETTLETKKYIVTRKILPYFGNMQIQDIKPVHIRKWQSKLLETEYSQTYIRTIHNQLTAIFNYAVKFHNLRENPCHKAGSIGKKEAEEMKILSLQQFEKMLEFVTDDENRCFYIVAFWTGMRKGEILALTYKDVDRENKTISITKNYQVVGKKEIISDPKTPKSKRVIKVNNIVIECIDRIRDRTYRAEETDRIFFLSRFSIRRQLITACKKANVPIIRVHDLRHSHASYLLSKGLDITILSKRLGHEKLQTTLNVYCHVSKKAEDRLDIILNG